jgi:hypothetical protein
MEAASPRDIEQEYLDRLAALSEAIAGSADASPDLLAARQLISDLFEEVTLARAG